MMLKLILIVVLSVAFSYLEIHAKLEDDLYQSGKFDYNYNLCLQYKN